MIKWILSWFAPAKRTFETITADLQKVVSDLHDHADEHDTHALKKQAEAMVLMAEVDAHQLEREKSKAVALNIGRLMHV